MCYFIKEKKKRIQEGGEIPLIFETLKRFLMICKDSVCCLTMFEVRLMIFKVFLIPSPVKLLHIRKSECLANR